MSVRYFILPALLVVSVACSQSQPNAPDVASVYNEQLGAGEAIVETACAPCHAIGPTDKSRHAEAPAFRTLSENYPIEALAEPLAEGIMVGHPDMPEFQFEPDQIDAVIAYIEHLQPDQK